MFKRVTKKRFIECSVKLIIILAVFVAAYFALDRIMLIKSRDGIAQMQAYYKQPEGTVDALFVGSSHIFCHINTGVLWDEYGISGFDLAGAEQPFWNSYYFIKEALKTQRPKVIVLDITTPGVRPIDYQPENWLITNTYGLKRSADRYENIKVSSIPDSFKRMLIPLNSTHGRYSDLSEEDFAQYAYSVDFKGFDPRESIVKFERPDVAGVTERGELSDKEDLYLRKIIDYTKSQGVPLLFFSSPYIVTAEEQAKFNTIFDIADEYGVPYIDCNKLYDEIGLDFDNDFAEILHLNRTGNAKLTSYLGGYLKDNFGLSDHRGDPRYSSWDSDARRQRQDNDDFFLMQAAENDDITGYLKQLKNDNYVVFCTTAPGYEGLKDQSVAPYLEELGITQDMLTPLGAFILQKGKCIYESHDYEFKAAINDGRRRMVFYRTLDDDIGHTFTHVRNNGSVDYGSVDYQRVTAYKTYTFENEGISFYVYDTLLDKAVGRYTYNEQ